MRLLALLLLVACDPVPPEVGFRRVAAAHLQACIDQTRCIGDAVLACFEAARQECLDAGYPKECAYGEREGSC